MNIENIEFIGMSLSQIEPTNLSPAQVFPSTLKPIEEDLHPIIPALLNQSINSDPYTILKHFHNSPSLIVSLNQHLSCACGQISSDLLACGHFVCSFCMNSKICPNCNTLISPYQQNHKAYPCLSCKTPKPRRSKCPHYCLNCIFYKMSIKESFSCFICCVRFDKNAFSQVLGKCTACGLLGNFTFELNCGHFFCKNCLGKATNEKSCPKCHEKISSKELLKLQKNFKYQCHLCFIIKPHEKFSIQGCCGTKFCLKCVIKSSSIICCSPSN